jgi:hypothetical protein
LTLLIILLVLLPCFFQFFPSVCLFSLVPQSFNWEFFSELKDSVLLMAILPTSWKQEFLSLASLVAGEIWFFLQWIILETVVRALLEARIWLFAENHGRMAQEIPVKSGCLWHTSHVHFFLFMSYLRYMG